MAFSHLTPRLTVLCKPERPDIYNPILLPVLVSHLKPVLHQVLIPGGTINKGTPKLTIRPGTAFFPP
jgi:hypothetical protein